MPWVTRRRTAPPGYRRLHCGFRITPDTLHVRIYLAACPTYRAFPRMPGPSMPGDSTPREPRFLFSVRHCYLPHPPPLYSTYHLALAVCVPPPAPNVPAALSPARAARRAWFAFRSLYLYCQPRSFRRLPPPLDSFFVTYSPRAAAPHHHASCHHHHYRSCNRTLLPWTPCRHHTDVTPRRLPARRHRTDTRLSPACGTAPSAPHANTHAHLPATAALTHQQHACLPLPHTHTGAHARCHPLFHTHTHSTTFPHPLPTGRTPAARLGLFTRVPAPAVVISDLSHHICRWHTVCVRRAHTFLANSVDVGVPRAARVTTPAGSGTLFASTLHGRVCHSTTRFM